MTIPEHVLPKYYLIKQNIIKQIDGNQLKPDEMLPSEKDIMEQYGVSRITARKALGDLAVEGYIYKIQGKGSYVKNSHHGSVKLSRKLYSCSEEITKQGLTPSRRVLVQKMVPCDAETAARLNIQENEPVLCFERIYYADGIPISHANSIICTQYLPNLEDQDLGNKSLVELVTTFYGLEVERSKRTIEAISAYGDLAKYLKVKDGYPLLRLESVSNCIISGGKSLPYEYNISHYRTDIIKLEQDVD